jgi:hypothetical protein
MLEGLNKNFISAYIYLQCKYLAYKCNKICFAFLNTLTAICSDILLHLFDDLDSRIFVEQGKGDRTLAI